MMAILLSDNKIKFESPNPKDFDGDTPFLLFSSNIPKNFGENPDLTQTNKYNNLQHKL